tara:strand:+ start:1352 stop:1726 length:375 start_codon:yes stop_codon:yes gene_type:complete
MPSGKDKSKFGLWLSPEFLAEQVSDLKELQQMLQASIKESIDEDKNWDDEGLLMLMFEFYSCTTNQLKIYLDALSTKPKINKETKKEEYYINSINLDMLFSLARLAAVSEHCLFHDHRISFKVH